MKFYILLIPYLFVAQGVFGQRIGESQTPKQDSSRRDSSEVGKKNTLKLIFDEGKRAIDQDVKKDNDYSLGNKDEGDDELGFYGGITFSRFDLGLAKMLDHGSMTLSGENEFLDYKGWKSVNVGFDVLKLGYKVSNHFRVYASAGLDWTHFRLKKDVVFLEDTAPLDYIQSGKSYKKNRFSSSYIRLPISFEYSSAGKGKNNKFKASAGPIFGVLIHGSQKFVSKDEGKQKSKDDYNYAPFRYGGFVRVGYDGFGVFVKYYMNDLFVNSPDQQELKNLSFGVSFFL